MGGILEKKMVVLNPEHHETARQSTPGGLKKSPRPQVEDPRPVGEIEKIIIMEIFLVTTYYNIALDL